MAAPRQGNHLLALDALRGVAALIVVNTHISWTTSLSHTPFDRNGYLMVDFFFALSGFVIAMNYRDRISDAASTGRFIWLRFWRLYPLHLTFLLVFLGIEFLKLYLERSHGLVIDGGAFSRNNLGAFLTNLALVQSFGINGPYDTFNGPSWSISTEFYTYGVFALVLLLGRRKNLTLMSLLIAALSLCVFLAIHDGLAHSSDKISEFRCLYGFFDGVLAYELLRVLSRRKWHAGASSALPLALIAAIAALVLFKPFPMLDLLMPPLSGLLIVSLAMARGSLVSHLLTRRAMVWLGAVSYSIYLVHFSIIWFLDLAIRLGFGAVPVNFPGETDRQLLSISPLLGDVFLVIAFSLVLVTSHFTYSYIEAPARAWSRRRMLSKPTVSAEATATSSI